MRGGDIVLPLKDSTSDMAVTLMCVLISYVCLCAYTQVVGMRGGDIVLPLKDSTSDMAVISRKGSELVKQIREKKESNKSRARWGRGLSASFNV